MSYEQFIWFYLHPTFAKIKNSLDNKEKKGQSVVTVVFKEDSSIFMDFDKDIRSLDHRYCEETIHISDKEKGKMLAFSTLELEKVTELIYHEFGLPNLVREVRGKGNKYFVVGPSE